MADSLKKKTVKGVAWTSLNQFLNMGLGFVIGVILARLLSPSDYGLLAMIGVFNAIAFSFLDSGYGVGLSWAAGIIMLDARDVLPIIKTDEYFDDGLFE